MVPVLSIVSWNIENLAPYLAYDAVRTLADVLQHFDHPDVLCLQEVRIRGSDAAQITAMRGALRGYQCHASLARDPQNVTFRGGRAYGVCLYFKDSLDAVPQPGPAWDREGRVATIELPNLKLAIINVYGVNGTDKQYYDPDLGVVAGDRHTFKRRFNDQLKEYCRTFIDRGLSLVLIGDFNISRTARDTFPRLRTEEPHAGARRAFNEELIPALEVVDIFRELHPDARKYTWFNRRARSGKLDAARVDFALVSHRLRERTVAADILDDVEARFHSDHAPIFVRLKTDLDNI
jgi:exodeoxyribonuclease-3